MLSPIENILVVLWLWQEIALPHANIFLEIHLLNWFLDLFLISRSQLIKEIFQIRVILLFTFIWGEIRASLPRSFSSILLIWFTRVMLVRPLILFRFYHHLLLLQLLWVYRVNCICFIKNSLFNILTYTNDPLLIHKIFIENYIISVHSK